MYKGPLSRYTWKGQASEEGLEADLRIVGSNLSTRVSEYYLISLRHVLTSLSVRFKQCT